MRKTQPDVPTDFEEGGRGHEPRNAEPSGRWKGKDTFLGTFLGTASRREHAPDATSILVRFVRFVFVQNCEIINVHQAKKKKKKKNLHV